MSRYIRTKDGRIIDIQRFIDEEKDTPYYYDFEFDEIKNEEDSCSLNWTAVGSKENSIKEQVGKRCQFGATISSPFIAQADTIEELCDCYLEDCGGGIPCIITKGMWVDLHKEKALRKETTFYACVIKRDDKGTHIESIAKMNEEGEFVL